jgi:beta-glucosidase
VFLVAVSLSASVGQSKFVDEACLGGGGSSKVDPLYTVPPLEGMQDVLRELGSSATVAKVTVADDLSNLDDARKAAEEADVVVLMAGCRTAGAADADRLHKRAGGDWFELHR